MNLERTAIKLPEIIIMQNLCHQGELQAKWES